MPDSLLTWFDKRLGSCGLKCSVQTTLAGREQEWAWSVLSEEKGREDGLCLVGCSDNGYMGCEKGCWKEVAEL